MARTVAVGTLQSPRPMATRITEESAANRNVRHLVDEVTVVQGPAAQVGRTADHAVWSQARPGGRSEFLQTVKSTSSQPRTLVDIGGQGPLAIQVSHLVVPWHLSPRQKSPALPASQGVHQQAGGDVAVSSARAARSTRVRAVK